MILCALSPVALGATTKHTARGKNHVRENPQASRKMARLRHSHTPAAASSRTRGGRVPAGRRGRRRVYERFTADSYATGQTTGDIAEGEDPIVRQAAIEALGDMNGTAVVIDPMTGRILAMVNQRLALGSGAQPCSTIKLAVGLAALREGIVTKETEVRIGRRSTINLTEALAHSNNAYFEALGRKLGFEKVSLYAHQFGLGELAGLNIAGEHEGVFPAEEIPARAGGVGKMCSFGEGISLTPLQLGALVSAIANGGTLLYLQHPLNQQQVANYQPVIKRMLGIQPILAEMQDGMSGAVEYGTARSLRENFLGEPVLGKTGTCSRGGTRLGWFASYASTPRGKIATVFFLEGGRPTFGPKAAELTGRFYKGLQDRNYFAAR